MQQVTSDAAQMTSKPHVEWFHGSPRKLSSLHAGSTVTPVITLARAFSHKPIILEIEVQENADCGKRNVEIRHDGTKPGYLYRVIVSEPSRDLVQHPDSTGARGEEMLTTRELNLVFIEEVPVKPKYQYTEEMEQ